MNLLLEKIEEFNIGREKRFRGDVEKSTLYVVHDLDAKELNASLKRLRELTGFVEVQTLHISKLEDELSSIEDKDSVVFTTMHLSLDNEINTHRRISNLIQSHEVFQLNPYNKIAKIFDDKYLFYALMIANAIKQPYTVLLKQNDKQEIKLDSKFSGKNLIIKPRNGTENIDCQSFSSISSKQAKNHIEKIQGYDDCVIQEQINFNSEFKVLYLHGKFHAKNPIERALEAELYEFVDLIDDYAKNNQIIMPDIFSLDILETMDNGYIILEANIRPAAIHKF